MRTNKIKKLTSLTLLSIFLLNTTSPITALEASSSSDLIYPLKQISKLECRFTDFGELNSDCKEDLPILKTSDYQRYATENGWYNKYTRLYTVLWWSSYKYGWDVWNGWHMWVDIATAKGTPVYSIAEWTVIIASELSMLWNNVTIKHNINWKEIVSSYSHMSKIDVQKWDKVKAWTKIWEVGSTWNSTWNHLHFQIDIDTTSSPAYYSYESCPYSYYKISEEWVCFGELEKLTVDPLAFLETKWAILNNITTTTKVNVNKNTSTTTNTNTNNQAYSIFDRTVYIWYSSDDVKQVQNIYRSLGYYNGPISWDYNDVLESVIDYQVATKVIENRNSTWAGWFGPATRTQTKEDYEKYLATWSTNNSSDTITEVTNVNSTTQKISKEKLMTREEIEAKEVEEFIKWYNIDLKFQNASSNVALWKTEVLKLTVTDKRNKPFIWNMPGWMTFILNTETASVFPTKLFNFTDWKRDIQVTWLKEWITKLYIKIWTVTVKTFDINVFNTTKTIYPSTSSIISPNSITMWDSQSAIWVFKDSNNTNLINVPFGSTYKIVASEWNKVCIKTWTLKNISQVYKRKCDESEFKSEITFTYNDTISWLLIYDYKAINKNAKFEIINTYNNQVLATKSLKVTEPKWLANTYEYKNDVLTMLEKGVATWINKWYFLENRDLTEYDAHLWVKNSLVSLNNQTTDTKVKAKITNNIKDIETQMNKTSKYTSINRWQFLAMTYKYLVINQETTVETKKYRDLTETENKLATFVLWNKTFKDQFGESYFQPTKNITRWEATFMLANIFNSYNNKFLTLK